MDTILSSLLFTIQQSLCSTLICAVLGTLGAFGLLGLHKGRSFTSAILSTPSFLPSLFVILAALNTLSPFPFGLGGIVLAHALTFAGFFAVRFSNIIENKTGGWMELAAIESASRWRLFWIIIRYLKNDLFLLSLTIFSVCMTSFSIPLVLGHFEQNTLEVLLYQKLILENNLSQSAIIFLLQLLVVGVFSFFFLQFPLQKVAKKQHLTLGWKPALLPLITLYAWAFFPLIFLVRSHSLQQVLALPELRRALQNTFHLSLLTGAFSLALLLLVIFYLPQRKLERLLLSLGSPSTTALGFLFILFQFRQGLLPVALCLALLHLPTLFRMYLWPQWHQILQQIYVAQLQGAHRGFIWSYISLPQLSKELFRAAGISALWASGEFALLLLLSPQTPTLNVLAQQLLGSYRLDQSLVITVFSLALGGGVWFLFQLVEYVTRQKSLSKMG